MITVLTAFIVDFIIGDPHTKLHPVALIGRWISLLERLFYNEKSTKWEHFILGGLTVVITLLFVYNITLALVLALEFLPNEHWSYIIQGILLSFMICPRSLAKAGREVYRYLVRHHLRIAQLKVGKLRWKRLPKIPLTASCRRCSSLPSAACPWLSSIGRPIPSIP